MNLFTEKYHFKRFSSRGKSENLTILPQRQGNLRLSGNFVMGKKSGNPIVATATTNRYIIRATPEADRNMYNCSSLTVLRKTVGMGYRDFVLLLHPHLILDSFIVNTLISILHVVCAGQAQLILNAAPAGALGRVK